MDRFKEAWNTSRTADVGLLQGNVPSPIVSRASGSVELPRCKRCKKTLNNFSDRQKSRDKWWTNCKSCRSTNATKWRDKRDAGSIVSQLPQASSIQTSSNTGTARGGTATPRKKQKPFEVARALAALAEPLQKKTDQVKCAECGQRPRAPRRIVCGHLLCDTPCYEDVMYTARSGRTYVTCKACDRTWPCAVPYMEEDDNSEDDNSEDSRVELLTAITKEPEQTECSICGDNLPEKELLELSTCSHRPDVCKGCFLGWLNSQLESTSSDRMQCPSSDCGQPITHEDVKRHAPDDVFVRYSIFFRGCSESLTLPQFR